MDKVVDKFTSVDLKVRKLIERHWEIKESLINYQNEIQELRKIKDQQQTTISELKDKIKLLKISRITETKEGAVDAKLKINEMIREIDKCIGLLNR